MSRAPKDALTRITDVSTPWGNLRPAKSFAGLTLDQFKEVVKPSLEVRTEIVELESKLQSAIARRARADGVSLDAVQRVIHGVKSDPEEGEDGELYATMGFVRKSDRSSGLTRRRQKDEEAPPAGKQSGNGLIPS
jgi:hypothetical protein